MTPHVAQHTTKRSSAIDRRTTRYAGHLASPRRRKRVVEEIFGWLKMISVRKTRHRGVARVGWMFTVGLAVDNVVRMRNLAMPSRPALVDDDTVAVPGWLAAHDAAIRGHGAVAAGGPVEPALEPGFEPPAWWSDPRIRSIFGLDRADPDPDERVVTIRWPLWLGCCNSIYSKRLLHDHGGFRTDCGPMGPRYRVAQDTDLNVRLERAGVPIHYVRDARIRHRITADRLSRRFLLRRAYSAGMTNAAAWALLDARSGAAGVKQLARAALRVVASREPARTTAACRFAYWLGYLRQKQVIAFSRR